MSEEKIIWMTLVDGSTRECKELLDIFREIREQLKIPYKFVLTNKKLESISKEDLLKLIKQLEELK